MPHASEQIALLKPSNLTSSITPDGRIYLGNYRMTVKLQTKKQTRDALRRRRT
jgi:hypothetical protein